MGKLNIWVICGGASSEHNISIRSARHVVRLLGDMGHQVSVAYVSIKGQWVYYGASEFMMQPCPTVSADRLIQFHPGTKHPFHVVGQSLPCDCVFPLIHGTTGEDGVLQGLLNVLGVPFVGCGVLSSALCMAKHISKVVLKSAGLRVVPWLVVNKGQNNLPTFEEVQDQLGVPFFIKPSQAGSSCGVSKVKDKSGYHKALQEAFVFDDVVLMEQAIVGRELECSVIGTDLPQVSLPGEIKPHTEFYSYEAKYILKDGASTISPACVDSKLQEQLNEKAAAVYQALGCQGMARVDFFLDGQGVLWVNEVNTIPGFTEISLFAKNWAASGVEHHELLAHLIDHAMARHASLVAPQDYRQALAQV